MERITRKTLCKVENDEPITVIKKATVEVCAEDNWGDISNPKTNVVIKIHTECMEYKPGRVTTDVERSLTLKDGKLWWPFKKCPYEAVNSNDIVSKIKRILDNDRA